MATDLLASAIAAARARYLPNPPGSEDSTAHVDAWYEWVERAAVLEFQGGLTRRQAERRASQEMRSKPDAMDVAR